MITGHRDGRGSSHAEVASLEADEDGRAARLAAVIARKVDTAPPLSAEQIEQLRGLLTGTGAASTTTGTAEPPSSRHRPGRVTSSAR